MPQQLTFRHFGIGKRNIRRLIGVRHPGVNLYERSAVLDSRPMSVPPLLAILWGGLSPERRFDATIGGYGQARVRGVCKSFACLCRRSGCRISDNSRVPTSVWSGPSCSPLERPWTSAQRRIPLPVQARKRKGARFPDRAPYLFAVRHGSFTKALPG